MQRLVGSLILLLSLPHAYAQLAFDTEAVAPERFVAAHGQRAVAMGYASRSLEMWAYPFQILDGYKIGFRAGGQTSEIDGAATLRRITYSPEAITRTYIGPDFIVRERLFVPLDQQAIYATYTVEGHQTLEIVVHFKPILDLMWPFSVGGQNTHWDEAASAYVLSDGAGKHHALVGTSAAAVVSHDPIYNSTEPGAIHPSLSFAVHSGSTVVVAQNDEGKKPADRVRELLAAESRFETEAQTHYTDLLARTWRIETPDASVNKQLQWAQIAVDQAWVCNQAWGCGLVAGYGPSRGGRRPQYDWFFAGDGLIAIQALIDSGDYARAKAALDFIDKYQNPQTGMLWHEISQSADPADWAEKYPYMFVHIDITLEYLPVIAHYVTASGDKQFLEQNWPGIEAAYRYAKSLLNPEDDLPRIPASKSGGNEQDRLTDDIGLATSWVAASSAFAQLAALHGDQPLAGEATALHEKAKTAAARRYWSTERNTWVDGYDTAGHPVFRESASGLRLVNLLDPQQSNAILDRIASADFQSDWGTRGVATTSPRYHPDSYGSGSVSALASAGIATAYWNNHRPETAFSIWSALLPWGTLDSMGHMHELLTGDFYHQQVESVPEQTWSSAAFLSSTLEGLLGLKVEANHLTLDPHLPSEWDHVTLTRPHLRMTLSRNPRTLALEIENSGDPFPLTFINETFTVPKGKTHKEIRDQGGILVSVTPPNPQVGDASQGVKIISTTWSAGILTITADAPKGGAIYLHTQDKPSDPLTRLSPGIYELPLHPTTGPTKITIHFAPSK